MVNIIIVSPFILYFERKLVRVNESLVVINLINKRVPLASLCTLLYCFLIRHTKDK
jgi:hypothetical protein